METKYKIGTKWNIRFHDGFIYANSVFVVATEPYLSEYGVKVIDYYVEDSIPKDEVRTTEFNLWESIMIPAGHLTEDIYGR